MKEARFFYAPNAEDNDRLPPEEAAHALRVLRLKADDEIFLMDGKGRFFRAEVTLTSRQDCCYRITEELPQLGMDIFIWLLRQPSISTA